MKPTKKKTVLRFGPDGKCLNWPVSNGGLSAYTHTPDIKLPHGADGDPVVAGLATIPSRIAELPKVIASLHPQVDIIVLALNGFDRIPDFLSAYPKVLARLKTNDMGDANKFLLVDRQPSSYYFSCDDDILYPADYVEKMKAAVQRNKCLVTLHGSRIPGHVESYYRGRQFVAHCMHDSGEAYVHIPGSGVSAFHTSVLPLKYEDFTHANMADVFLGLRCEALGVRRMVMAHQKGWLTLLVDASAPSIFNQHRRNDAVQTKVVNQTSWAPFLSDIPA